MGLQWEWDKLRRDGFTTLTRIQRGKPHLPTLLPLAHLICKASSSWDAGLVVPGASWDAGLVVPGAHWSTFVLCLPVHKFMIALLEAKHQDICFSACGVLLNLTVDKEKRAILKEGGGIKK